MSLRATCPPRLGRRERGNLNSDQLRSDCFGWLSQPRKDKGGNRDCFVAYGSSQRQGRRRCLGMIERRHCEHLKGARQSPVFTRDCFGAYGSSQRQGGKQRLLRRLRLLAKTGEEKVPWNDRKASLRAPKRCAAIPSLHQRLLRRLRLLATTRRETGIASGHLPLAMTGECNSSKRIQMPKSK